MNPFVTAAFGWFMNPPVHLSLTFIARKRMCGNANKYGDATGQERIPDLAWNPLHRWFFLEIAVWILKKPTLKVGHPTVHFWELCPATASEVPALGLVNAAGFHRVQVPFDIDRQAVFKQYFG